MKVRSFLLAIAISAACLPHASAQQMPSAISAESTALPPGVTLVELFRWYRPATTDRFTGRELPWNWEHLGWRLEGTLGFISYTPFPGSHPLYQCVTNEAVQDYFTSMDPNCEGQVKFDWHPIIGYVASTQLAGTVPLYRCDTPRYAEDHFDSTAINCEGNKPGSVNEGPLGYIFF